MVAAIKAILISLAAGILIVPFFILSWALYGSHVEILHILPLGVRLCFSYDAVDEILVTISAYGNRCVGSSSKSCSEVLMIDRYCAVLATCLGSP